MNTPRSLTIANDETISTLIMRAERRVVFMAPAFSAAIGEALAEQWRRLGPDAVVVILDVAADAYRLGYGSFGALKKL